MALTVSCHQLFVIGRIIPSDLFQSATVGALGDYLGARFGEFLYLPVVSLSQ